MSPPARPDPEGTLPIRYAHSVIRYAVAEGASEARLLAAAGVERERLEDLDGQVEAEVMRALWEAAVDGTGDPDFGLHLGEQAQPGAVSAVGYAMLTASTAGDALDVLARYGPMIGTVRAILLDRGDLGRPAAVEMVHHMTGPLARGLRQPLEATMATLMTLVQAVTGRRLPVVGVAFVHARPPSGTATHERLFGVAPVFDAPAYRVTFDADALRWPSRSASPALHASFRREADRALEARARSVRARVKTALRAEFTGKVPTLGEVATDLAMSERTLQRHLEDEGTSFLALCDAVRHDLAAQYLLDAGRTVQEVAFLLGYSAPSAFNRAFKRWTGQTPGAFRKTAQRLTEAGG